MYFVHPQFKFNLSNIIKIFDCFLRPQLKELPQFLKKIFPEREIYFTDMGRTAFRLIIEKLNLKNSEILFPAYICDIFYPILKEYSIKPIFLDIEKETFNLKISEIEKKITKKTKAILICHTYGLPIELEKVLAIFAKYNLILIEDCAHAFGGKYNERFLGNFGKASFFSLYKLFPTLRGGIATIEKQANKKQIKLKKTSFNIRDFISLLNSFSFFSFLFKKTAKKIAPKYIRTEKLSEIGKINRVSLNLFFWEIKNLEQTIKKRKELGNFFSKELEKLGFFAQKREGNIFTFLSVLCPENIQRDKLVKKLRAKRVFVTRIWKDPIILNKEVQKFYKINLKEFPNTLEVSKRIINFPLQNFYQKKDIIKMIKIIKNSLQ